MFQSAVLLFILIIAFEVSSFIYAVVHHLIPAGHDGLEQLITQYFFLNHVFSNGVIPAWMPYWMQGMPAGWWFDLQSSLGQNILMNFGWLFKNNNFIDLFHLNILIERLSLAVGAWLWGSQYLKKPLAIFFFSLSLLSSCVWWTQPVINQRMIYLLPCIFFLIHRYVQDRRGITLFWAGVLFAIQMMGITYYASMVTLTVFLYAVLVFGSDRFRVLKTMFSFKQISILLGLAVLVILCFIPTMYGAGEMVSYKIGRTAAGDVSLASFLSYGGNLDLAKWKELIFGLSPEIDYTLYGGLLIVPCVFVALLNIQRQSRPVYIMIIVFVMISQGGAVAKFFYYAWPGMKYFRHLSFVAVFIKPFVFLLAAIGFEKLIDDGLDQQRRRSAFGVVFVSLAVMAVFFGLVGSDFIRQQLVGMVPTGMLEIAVLNHLASPLIEPRLKVSCFLVLLYALPFIGLYYFRNKFKLGLFFLGLVLLMDLRMYVMFEDSIRSTNISASDKKFFNFNPMEYLPKRVKDVPEGNDRLHWVRSLPLGKVVIYGHIGQFIGVDQMGSSFRTEHWLKPLDEMMRAYWMQDIDDVTVKPKGLVNYWRLDFPVYYPAASFFAGQQEGKILFFSDVVKMNDLHQVAQALIAPDYRGKIPLIFDMNKSPGRKDEKEIDAYIKTPYKLKQFNANELSLQYNLVDRPSAWMVYADIWHPAWRATIDGQGTLIYKANLAYKAIVVPQGVHEVKFSFYIPWWVRLGQGLLLFVSCLAFIILVSLAKGICHEKT